MQGNVVFEQLPFEGEWLTFWGGETKDQNQHHDSFSQKYAFDFVKVDESGATHSGDGSLNDDYYSFGQSVLCPADGEVVEVVDGVRDNKPMDTNKFVYPGNHVIIKHADGVYSMLAHFKQDSIQVRRDNNVTAGQELGLCGNSGNSSEPHIHFHVQDVLVNIHLTEDYEDEHIAKAVKATFKEIIVNGEVKQNYMPIKGDKVQNV